MKHSQKRCPVKAWSDLPLLNTVLFNYKTWCTCIICGMLEREDMRRLLVGRGNTTDTRGRSGGFGLIGNVCVLSLESEIHITNLP